MLVDVTIYREPVADMIAQSNGRSPDAQRICKGIYIMGHWSAGRVIAQRIVEEYPELDNDTFCYGVCDSIEQLVKRYDFDADHRKFFISFVLITKAGQESPGGWRWHKWGQYIGTQNPQHEYIADEPNIDRVFTYHVYHVAEGI